MSILLAFVLQILEKSAIPGRESREERWKAPRPGFEYRVEAAKVC